MPAAEPYLAAARRVLWLVTGAEKRAVVFADAAAVGRSDGAPGHEERS